MVVLPDVEKVSLFSDDSLEVGPGICIIAFGGGVVGGRLAIKFPQLKHLSQRVLSLAYCLVWNFC